LTKFKIGPFKVSPKVCSCGMCITKCCV